MITRIGGLNEKKIKNKKAIAVQVVLIAVLAIICFLWIFPCIFILLTSFRSNDSIMYDGYMFFPNPFTFENYIAVFENTSGTPVLRWLLNSFIVATASAVLTVIFSAMSAFAYARLKFKARTVIFTILLSTMMVPSVISLIPNYMTISSLNLKNTYWALIFPALGGVSSIFLMRQFLLSIPKEMDEAAYLDGANSVKLFFRILLPQMAPILVVVGLNSFLGSWNDLLWPIIVNTDNQMRTITSGLSVINSQYDRKYASQMAATVLSAVPVLIVYICAQKYLIRGISLTSGMKE